jgi:hypothetical protein
MKKIKVDKEGGGMKNDFQEQKKKTSKISSMTMIRAITIGK